MFEEDRRSNRLQRQGHPKILRLRRLSLDSAVQKNAGIAGE